MFKTLQDRKTFVHSLGMFYAGLGGLFGAYKTARDAFAAAKALHLYRSVQLDAADYATFRKGFKDFQDLRITLMVAKRDAQARMDAVLKDVNLTGLVVSPATHYTELG